MLKKLIIMTALLLTVQLNYGQKCKTPNGFSLDAGVNLGLWLSQSESRGTEREKFITKADFDTIVSMGLDHVRLPIDEVQLWDEKGNKLNDAFQLMHKAINWAIDAKLRVIIDLHIIRSHYFNATSNALWTDPNEQDKLENMWHQLSDELSRYPVDFVAYELLNEAVAQNNEDWNKLVGRLVQSIRKKEPNRTIVIGSNQYQKVETFLFLKVPENDKNIILSFHYYNPFGLTHFQAAWLELKHMKGPVNYPGDVITKEELNAMPADLKTKMLWAFGNYNKEKMFKEIQNAIQVAKKLQLPLFCGEFGAYIKTPKEPARLWYSDLTDIFRENNIAYCHWVYKGDFPLVDENSKPDYVLAKILVRK